MTGLQCSNQYITKRRYAAFKYFIIIYIGDVITGKTKTIEDYEKDIREIYKQLLNYPDSKTLKGQMYRRLSSWQPLVHVKIFQAQQEQMPWTEENLGYQVVPMLLKKDLLKEEDIDASQTGDYQAYFKTAGTEGWIPFLVERKGGKDTKGEKKGKENGNLKGAADIYGTLSNEKRRERFYREIDRFKLDPRFNTMYLIAECSYQDYLNYVPPFNGNKRNKDHIGMSVETRRATIAGLYIRGCIVIFAGTRTRAIQMYKDLIRQWLIKNYVSVLKLDDTPLEDEIALEDKLSQLLAEIHATKEALKITTIAMEVTA